MPTSPRISEARAGFTLFEVMLVLAIVGVMLTLTVPLLTGRIESARLIREAEDVAGQIRAAPLRARFRGQAMTLNPEAVAPDRALLRLEVSGDWSLAYEGELGISSIGVCTGGAVRVIAPSGRIRAVRVRPPFCETAVEGAPGSPAPAG